MVILTGCGDASPETPPPPPTQPPAASGSNEEAADVIQNEAADVTVEEESAVDVAAEPTSEAVTETVSEPAEEAVVAPAPAEENSSGPADGPPDLSAAAELLGISQKDLQDALGPPPPDFAAAAATLGISEQALQEALASAGAAPSNAQGEGTTEDRAQAETETTTSESTTETTEQATTTENSTLANTYPVVDTNETACYDLSVAATCPQVGAALYGQDAQYSGLQPNYVNNGDGTVTDLNTGLMWQQDPGAKMTYNQALANAESLTLGGYDDWRLPTIKELYSLIIFSGSDVSTCSDAGSCTLLPFIDTNFFAFEYGDTTAGERLIDSQFATSTRYVSTTMGNNETLFGVNFADGRIKGYEIALGGREKTFFVLYVRGNPDYGVNNFADNGDGTITDQATGLMWTQNDNGAGVFWGDALNYCETLEYAGHTDWRLPDAKELHTIVDYTRSPATTNSAAIDPVFATSTITGEDGSTEYPFYWASTTHSVVGGDSLRGPNAVYFSFGKALGYFNDAWLDVHGAGAQRTDPKVGDPADYPTGHGPQGDATRIYNYARCVRAGGVAAVDRTNEAIPDQSAQGGSGGSAPTGGEAPSDGGPSDGPPDFAAAAAQLGVTEQALKDALGEPPPDFAAAAATLGITEQALREALGAP
ncbi:MAG: DUF1566 domain-containing protein [Chloroflexota bacterium]